jgi:hypothetical protein
VLGLFAEGFSYALERTMLLGGMREQIGKIREMMAEANTALDDMFERGMSMRRDETTGDVDIVGRGRSCSSPTGPGCWACSRGARST